MAPLSLGFSRQDYGVIPPQDLPDRGIKPASLMSPALAAGFFTTSTTWEAPPYSYVFLNNVFCSALLCFLWLTIITLNYYSDDNRRHTLHLLSNMFSTLVSKIHCDLCLFTVVYNSIYRLFYGWIVILFPAFCYEHSVLFCFSPAPVPFRTLTFLFS